jgi:hypothetical protein
MKKIILTAIMVWTLFCVGPIDFSYAEELKGAEISEKNEPMILAQEKSTTSNYQFSEPFATEKVEKEEDDEEDEEDVEDDEYEDDDPDAGVRQKKRNEKRATKVKKH